VNTQDFIDFDKTANLLISRKDYTKYSNLIVKLSQLNPQVKQKLLAAFVKQSI